MSSQVRHLPRIDIKFDFFGDEEVTVDGCIADAHRQKVAPVTVGKDALRARKFSGNPIEGVRIRIATRNFKECTPIKHVCFVDIDVPKRSIAFP